MKQIILDVLEDVSQVQRQLNLSSGTARETIANLIVAAIKSNGEEKKTKEQEAKDSWVCNICGKSTWEIGWDYIGSGTNHLGCELKIEMNED